MEDLAPQALKILQIVWINIVLSGDNAVVIALACRGLPARRRRMGMVLGAGVAVGLRILFTVVVVSLLATPFLKDVGAGLLLWIAINLLAEGDDEAQDRIGETDRLWSAVRTIAIADAVMSLDNVIAIAAVAQSSMFLLVLGLAISIPLIIAGATLIMALLERLPVFVWAGAGLLGWVAGEMLISDPAVLEALSSLGSSLVHGAPGAAGPGVEPTAAFDYAAATSGAALVLIAGGLSRWRHHAAGKRQPGAAADDGDVVKEAKISSPR